MMTNFAIVKERLLSGTHLPIAIYLGFIGLMLALVPDATMTEPLPEWLVWPWLASFIGGTGLIFHGTATERSRMESVGHAFHLFGLSLFVAVLSVQGVDEAVALSALSAVSLMRMRTLRRSRRAQQEASRLLQAEEGE